MQYISPYRRENLTRLIPLYPHELADTIEARTALIEKLTRACRAERHRGIEGHWAYSRPRHVGMWRSLQKERIALEKIKTEAAQPPL